MLGQVWYLIVSIPDLCILSYFISSFQVQGVHISIDILCFSIHYLCIFSISILIYLPKNCYNLYVNYLFIILFIYIFLFMCFRLT